MRVLIAHPSAAVAAGLASALTEELGVATTTATTLEAFWSSATAERPDIAVADAQLAPGQEAGLCRRLAELTTRPIIITRPGEATNLELLEHGAAGIAAAGDGLPGVLEAVRTVMAGHTHVPPHLLGSLLHELIEVRRTERPVAPDRVDSLSPRERQVLGLLGHGADTREIAARLVISPYTAKTHINRLLGKLGLGSRTEAAAFAINHGVQTDLVELEAPGD